MSTPLWRANARRALAYLRRAQHDAPDGYRASVDALVVALAAMTRDVPVPLDLSDEDRQADEAAAEAEEAL